MTLPDALRKALRILREEKRGVVLTTSGAQYRFAPSAERMRGYLMTRSVRYNNEWQPWSTVESFDVDDILNNQWRVH